MCVFLFWLCWVFVAACRLSLAATSGDYSLVVVHRLLTAVACLVAEHRLLGVGASAAVAHQLSCSMSCGIFLDRGSNLCPLHWQVASYPLYHQGSPKKSFLLKEIACAQRKKWKRKNHTSTK